MLRGLYECCSALSYQSELAISSSLSILHRSSWLNASFVSYSF